MRHLRILLILCGLQLGINLCICQSDPEPDPGEKAFLPEVSYQGDAIYNLHGGIRSGFTFMGLLELGLSLKTERAGLWKGGELFLHVQNTHGGMASADLIGDLQVVSNIENGSHSYLYELWYRQQIGKISLLAGLHDLNALFLKCEGGGHFLNSAFGIHSGVALNTPVSIFPLTSLGVVTEYQLNESFSTRLGVYDGNPGDFDTDPHQLRFSLGSGNGVFGIWEFQSDAQFIRGQQSSIKLGTWYFHGPASQINMQDNFHGNCGLYGVADMEIIPAAEFTGRGVNAFMQISWAPADRNIYSTYLGTGLLFSSPFGQRPGDVLGIALAYAGISPLLQAGPEDSSHSPDMLNHETALEFSYRILINKHISLQPDFQYIIQPGANPGLENACVAILRLETGL